MSDLAACTTPTGGQGNLESCSFKRGFHITASSDCNAAHETREGVTPGLAGVLGGCVKPQARIFQAKC